VTTRTKSACVHLTTVAARADGDGVLTIAAVRARLEATKLHVVRLEDLGETPSGSTEDQLRELLRKRQQESKS
jgi:hypothetical protein